jgi:hypothetical protein
VYQGSGRYDKSGWRCKTGFQRLFSSLFCHYCSKKGIKSPVLGVFLPFSPQRKLPGTLPDIFTITACYTRSRKKPRPDWQGGRTESITLQEVVLKAIKIQIKSFISADQPGFVEGKFTDARGKEHTVQDKVPVLTDKDLDANSEYPQEGVIACEIIHTWKDKDERTIFTVSTEKPWAVDTIEGLTEFDMWEEQLTELK